MNRPRITFAFLAIFMSAMTVAGQTAQGQNPGAGTPASPSGKSAQKSITVETQKGTGIIDVPATDYREVGQAQVSYFEESDATEVRDELEVYRGRGQYANMSLVYTVKGKRVVRPEEVSVGIALFTNKAKAEKTRSFMLEADGRPIALDGLTVRFERKAPCL